MIAVLLMANLMLEIVVSIPKLLRVRYALDRRLLCFRRPSRYLRQSPRAWSAGRCERRWERSFGSPFSFASVPQVQVVCSLSQAEKLIPRRTVWHTFHALHDSGPICARCAASDLRSQRQKEFISMGRFRL